MPNLIKSVWLTRKHTHTHTHTHTHLRSKILPGGVSLKSTESLLLSRGIEVETGESIFGKVSLQKLYKKLYKEVYKSFLKVHESFIKDL